MKILYFITKPGRKQADTTVLDKNANAIVKPEG